MSTTPKCFIAMPITTRADEAKLYNDVEHWNHVMEHLFVPAICSLGWEAIRPVAKGSSMIHAEIVRNLEEADLVACDLSGHNPNVFFELGVRTSLDRPMALVRDEETEIPFDLGGVNVHSYDSSILGWHLDEQRQSLADHLARALAESDSHNPLWQTYGLTIRAQAADPAENPLQASYLMLADEIAALRTEIGSASSRGGRTEMLEAVRGAVTAFLVAAAPVHGSRVKALVVDILGSEGHDELLSGAPLNVALGRIGVPLSTDDSGHFHYGNTPPPYSRNPTEDPVQGTLASDEALRALREKLMG